MLEVKLSVELGSPADKVWNVVGNFNGLPDWHPCVDAEATDRVQTFYEAALANLPRLFGT